jgi:hypothetical protein
MNQRTPSASTGEFFNKIRQKRSLDIGILNTGRQGARAKSSVPSPRPPTISRTYLSYPDEHAVRSAKIRGNSPFTGGSIMATWVITVLHRGATPSFSGGSRNA